MSDTTSRSSLVPPFATDTTSRRFRAPSTSPHIMELYHPHYERPFFSKRHLLIFLRRLRTVCCCGCAFVRMYLLNLLNTLYSRSILYLFFVFFFFLLLVCLLCTTIIYYLSFRAWWDFYDVCIVSERIDVQAAISTRTLPFSFGDCFNLSMQTFTTVGYGYLSPNSR